jgi:ribosomal protein S18 acetylase RimI-like enzyme
VPSTWTAEPHELETVTRLMAAFRDHLSLSEPSDDDMRASVGRLLEDPSTEFLLGAPEPGAPAGGVVQLRFRYGVWRTGGDCLLEDLFVAPPARGAGLGRALVQAAIDRARVRGCRRIELDVNERNEAAQGLYGSFGFSSESKGYRARDLYMRLHID